MDPSVADTSAFNYLLNGSRPQNTTFQPASISSILGGISAALAARDQPAPEVDLSQALGGAAGGQAYQYASIPHGSLYTDPQGVRRQRNVFSDPKIPGEALGASAAGGTP